MKSPEREMIRWGKLLFERRLISGWGGNLSCRGGDGRFLITGQHAPLGFLTARDLVEIDATGKPQSEKQRASSETPLHLAVYRGTDAEAVIHVHPPLVLAYSLGHDHFSPLSYEEKYTIGRVAIIPQDTPTVTKPQKVVEALRYSPIAIIKGHGTVAIGRDFQEAFLFTDLLEEAVRCQSFDGSAASGDRAPEAPVPAPEDIPPLPLFSREHFDTLVRVANEDNEFRTTGADSGLTTSLTLELEEVGRAWTVEFFDGRIGEPAGHRDGQFLISGKEEWWDAVFRGRIDPFLATQQGKLKLKRGELAQLSRWYKPFHRAFSLWQTIPIQ